MPNVMQTAGALGGIAASFVRVPTEVNEYFEIFSFLNIMILLLLSFLILPV